MVDRQYLTLYENGVSSGALFISVDNEKYLIHFKDFIKVSVLEEEPLCGITSRPDTDEQIHVKNSEEFGKWDDYTDVFQLVSDHKVDKTSRKIGKVRSLTTTETLNPTLDPDNIASSRTVYESPKASCSDDSWKNKKRKFDSVVNNKCVENTLEQSEARVTVKTKVCDSDGYNELKNGIGVIDMGSFQEVDTKEGDVLLRDGSPRKEISSTDYNSKVSLPSAVKKAHQVMHVCRDCHTNFDTYQAMQEHREVKPCSEYQCDECSELFQYQAFLDVHKQSNHGSVGLSIVFKDNQYRYSCDSCGMLSKSLMKLQIHNLIHTGEGIFQCCRCPETFGEKIDLNQHMKIHKSSGMIKCRWCNKWFVDKATLAKHKLICKVIKCHLCDNIFPNKTNRNQHYKDFHPNDILRCDQCPYMFSSQQELNDHLVKHSKFKKQQCTVCGSYFSRLKKHMMVHKNQY